MNERAEEYRVIKITHSTHTIFCVFSFLWGFHFTEFHKKCQIKLNWKQPVHHPAWLEFHFFTVFFWEYNSRLLGIFNKIILFSPVRTAVNFIWWIFTSSKRQITYKNIMLLIKTENLSFNLKYIFCYWFTMDIEINQFEYQRLGLPSIECICKRM